MNTADVWRLVEQARRELDDAGARADEVARRVVELLAQRRPAEIVAFEQPLWDLLAESYRADLWAAAYVINGGASDDGFDYFRGWLIAQGRTVFHQALADPDSLAGHPVVVRAAAAGEDLWCEDILGVAWDAHLAATGEEPPADAFTVRYPRLDPGWDFDFDDEAEMRRRLPRLTTLYHQPEEA
ncbi:DUF4240 domain-containing protein [Herbidospora sp. NBRC 101105]|uniref:DUF4240 domain-containing protein n=1 Tax=Herbidospora sp. NBRC 101105 TaxID=3032195 RepID=UPI0024A134EA|nr:DUF4240 domain-containing protein [Herbidospora sp. NBRC 101105]GLX97612.1 hypothetical protein Hesp01_55620 [Herbidospora sp. NBRC 101105]